MEGVISFMMNNSNQRNGPKVPRLNMWGNPNPEAPERPESPQVPEAGFVSIDNGSFENAFIHAARMDLQYCESKRQDIEKLRLDEHRYHGLIEQEVELLLKHCQVSPVKVSGIITEGLDNLQKYVREMKEKHVKGNEKEYNYREELLRKEESMISRLKLNNEIQARYIKEVVKSRAPAKPQQHPAPPTRKEKSAKKKPRKLLMMIRLAEGCSYATVVNKLLDEVDPVKCGTHIFKLSCTKKGDVLIQLLKKSNWKEFASQVEKSIGNMGRVEMIGTHVTLEIRDIDSSVDEEKVKEALRGVLESPEQNWKLALHKPNRRGLKLALITLDQEEAIRFENEGNLWIGETACGIRRRVTVTRCFKCLGFGHVSDKCNRPDRSKVCYRCGREGHKSNKCEHYPHCFLCEESKEDTCYGHIAGSTNCKVFKKALQAAEAEREKN